ncbi:unnamed protein product, partial [Meganyctiphanes norvegica]
MDPKCRKNKYRSTSRSRDFDRHRKRSSSRNRSISRDKTYSRRSKSKSPINRDRHDYDNRKIFKERSRKERPTSKERYRKERSTSRERSRKERSTSRERSRKERSIPRERSRKERSTSRERSRKERSASKEKYQRGRSISKERAQRIRSYSRERVVGDRSTSKDRYRNRSKSHSLISKDKENSKNQSDKSSSSLDSEDSHKKKHKKKSKKSKKKKKSMTSSSSESEDDEVKLLTRLEIENDRIRNEKMKRKEHMKAKETPEEKRLRRLQKKEAKERMLKQQMGWDNEYLHFTNADNPYGDNNLLETYVWTKKLQKEGLDNLTREEIEKRNRAKMEENRHELEKVKKRRQERELERQEREHMMELEQRQREAAQFSQFSKQEDQFQLEQARLRSAIRIQDGRAKAIDLLAQYVSSEGDVTAVDMHEPYTHLTGLTLGDLEDLLEDIKVYMKLEAEVNTYWTDLTIIVQDELRRLRQRDSIEEATAHRQGIHASVAADVSSVFHNKSLDDLNKLQCNIESKLAGPTTGIDVGYWESLLSQLKAHQARARLRERHRLNLRQKLELLKAEQGVKVDPEDEQPSSQHTEEEEEETNIKEEPRNDQEGDDEVEEYVSGNDDEEDTEGDNIIQAALTAYTSGRYSPKLLSANKLEPGTVVVDEEEDEQRLAFMRRRVTGQGPGKTLGDTGGLTAQEKIMRKEAQNSMDGDEVQFSVEAKLDSQHYLWSDKYRPRKPRYFNRVHTGFEWNKYNQTHYDMDNPPPKIVQGYKFNIFYPDLIEKSKTPQYELIPCPDNKDFALLKFTAGPPYEDIAFKIVNREWEYSYKRGFRCQFHNNIFQLWFHFKRYRYRR